MYDSIIFCEFTKWKQNPINNRDKCSLQNNKQYFLLFFYYEQYLLLFFLLWTVPPGPSWTVPPAPRGAAAHEGAPILGALV